MPHAKHWQKEIWALKCARFLIFVLQHNFNNVTDEIQVPPFKEILNIGIVMVLKEIRTNRLCGGGVLLLYVWAPVSTPCSVLSRCPSRDPGHWGRCPAHHAAGTHRQPCYNRWWTLQSLLHIQPHPSIPFCLFLFLWNLIIGCRNVNISTVLLDHNFLDVRMK